MKRHLISLCFAWALFSCQKEVISSNDFTSIPTTSTEIFNSTGQNLLLQGNLENAIHNTSGTAKVYEDKVKKRTLVLENFKTDAGPDLHIYLAEDKSVTNFIQISDKVQNGTILLQIPTEADLQRQNYVLIWCRKYSVLFGFALIE